MTTLWEKIQAEIAVIESELKVDLSKVEAKFKDLFEHHASVDMGKTADIVLATPAPAVDATPVDIAPAPIIPVVVEPVVVAPAPVASPAEVTQPVTTTVAPVTTTTAAV